MGQGTRKMGRAALILPRLLTRQQAATYCGVGSAVFDATCPVQPISMGPDKRLERYDVRLLDDWIDRMRPDAVPLGRNWLDEL